MERLFEILSYRRNYETSSEHDFLRNVIAKIPNIKFDTELNAYVRIGEPHESETMFSCHTDTVHWAVGKQKFLYFDDLGIIAKTTLKSDPDFDNECLGADDGAGIWIMLEMIDAGVPGLYIFHRGEECGGIGSSFIAEDTPWLVEGIKRCIAFDRRGNHDVITHQAGGRCCSDDFAWALASALSDGDFELDYYPSQTGVFTDSANYTEIIPECTNLSVGYQFEHTHNEELDVDHLVRLKDACLVLDWEALPTVRDPRIIDFTTTYTKHRDTKTATGSGKSWPTFNDAYQYDGVIPWEDFKNEYVQYQDALEICTANPEVVAELLLELGVTYGDIEAMHDDLYGAGSNGNNKYRYR